MTDWDGYEHRAPRKGRQRVGLMNPRADIRRCSCGGEIVLLRSIETELVAAIQTHQGEPRHVAWRERAGL